MEQPDLVITSAKNPTIKRLRKLVKGAKFRAAEGQTVLDGIHLCQSYLQAGHRPQLIIADSAKVTSDEITAIIKSDDSPSSLVILPSDLFATISPVKNNTGILFVIDIPTAKPESVLSHDAVLLDRVQDSGNIGTLLRTATASNVKQAYLSSGCASAWSPQALRAGMGAQFQIEVIENADLKQLISSSQLPVYGTSLQTTASLYDLDLRQPSGWLFGNEGRGASQELLDLCRQQVFIPQSSAVESLNVAASAAVCLFEQLRQRLK